MVSTKEANFCNYLVKLYRMTAVTQSMATSAAQGAAGSVADGSASAFATAGTPVVPVDGTTVGVAVTTAIVAAAVAVGVVVAGSDSGIFSNIMEYDIYPGRLDIYFAIPLEPLEHWMLEGSWRISSSIDTTNSMDVKVPSVDSC
jgi:hypothetical protein